MNNEEFSIFAMAMKTYYPREQILPNKQAMALWQEQLSDIPYKVAEVALKKWVATNKWSPSIAEIRGTAAAVQVGDIPDWGEGWQQVLTAIRKYGMYRIGEAMETFDEITKQCVQNLGFRNLCLSENIATDRANFRLIYEQLAARKQKEIQIPVSITTMIEQIRVEHQTLKLVAGPERE